MFWTLGSGVEEFLTAKGAEIAEGEGCCLIGACRRKKVVWAERRLGTRVAGFLGKDE